MAGGWFRVLRTPITWGESTKNFLPKVVRRWQSFLGSGKEGRLSMVSQWIWACKSESALGWDGCVFSYALSRSNDSFSSSWLPYSSTCSYLLLYTFSFSVPFLFQNRKAIPCLLPSFLAAATYGFSFPLEWYRFPVSNQSIGGWGRGFALALTLWGFLLPQEMQWMNERTN